MKVRLGDVRPNPFRNTERYPIDRVKVEALKASIDRTGFWDNVVARATESGDGVEIAYGHHRLVALREMFPPDHEVDLIVRDLADTEMLRIMADENMQEWSASAAVVIETVRAVRDYLHTAAEKMPTGKRGRPVENGTAAEIVAFLGWPERRVEDALRIISAEEQDILEPEDTADLDLAQAVVMRSQVARITDPEVRRKAITAVRAGLTSKEIGTRGIPDAVYEVRQETGYDPIRPAKIIPPGSVASALWREIDNYWRTVIVVNGQSMTRGEALRLIAENRNAEELIRSVRPWADQLADALDEMATEATRLAELLRAEQAVAIGASA